MRCQAQAFVSCLFLCFRHCRSFTTNSDAHICRIWGSSFRDPLFRVFTWAGSIILEAMGLQRSLDLLCAISGSCIRRRSGLCWDHHVQTFSWESAVFPSLITTPKLPWPNSFGWISCPAGSTVGKQITYHMRAYLFFWHFRLCLCLNFVVGLTVCWLHFVREIPNSNETIVKPTLCTRTKLPNPNTLSVKPQMRKEKNKTI